MKRVKKRNWQIIIKLSSELEAGRVTDSEEFKALKVIHGEKTWITGFIMLVKNSTFDNAIHTAQLKARRLTNLLVSENRSYCYPIIKSASSTDGKIEREVNSVASPIRDSKVDLDFTYKVLRSRLNRDSRINQQMAHFARGVRASEEDDPVNMIKEFFQVFNEENMHPRIKRYKPIRDLLNHPRITSKKTRELLNQNFSYMDFDFRPSKMHFDINSSKNLSLLREIGDELRTEAFFLHVENLLLILF